MFDIIYQDQNLLVINKPNNLAVQKTNKYAESLERILCQSELPLSSVPRQGIVHRLDRQTTGLLLIAKNSESFNFLSSLFKKRKIQKVYLALVEGILANESGDITFYVQKKFPTKGKIKMDLNSLYSSVCANPEIGQYLHAYSLKFSGSKKEKFLFQASLPDFFQKKLRELGYKKNLFAYF